MELQGNWRLISENEAYEIDGGFLFFGLANTFSGGQFLANMAARSITTKEWEVQNNIKNIPLITSM